MGNEILIYSDILTGEAADIVRQLSAMSGPVTVRINSPGGVVTEGLAIYNALRRYPDGVTVMIDGAALSIASLIAMAGRPVKMAEAGLMMIHAPWIAGATGNAEELRKLADALDANAQAMVSAYATKSGLSDRAVLAIMAGETWYTPEEALAAGFIDEIITDVTAAAAVRFDLRRFQRPPMEIFAMDNKDDKGNGPAIDPKSKFSVISSEEEFLARIRERNREMHSITAAFMHRSPIKALYDASIADPSVSLEQYRNALLTKLGEGSEPAAASLWADDALHFGSTSAAMPGADSHHREFKAAAADALLMRHSLPPKNPHPAAGDLMGMTITDIAAALLGQRGRSTRGMNKTEILAAGMTTSDLPLLLENVATKSLIQGFRETEAASHRAWTREGLLPDFKPASRVALSEAPGLLEVPEGGEYLQGALSDAKESIQLATYARILNLSRQMMVNDDLGQLVLAPQALGAAAARKESDLVYAILTTNGNMRDGNPLFDATHGNVASSGAALSATSLGEARAAMRKQRGLAGESYLNIVPGFLIVPVELETTAEQLMTNLTPRQAGDAIPAWITQLTVIAEPRLSDDSATTWYLATRPGIFDTIEVARLNANPLTMTSQKFETDAIKFKVVLDVAAKAIDWRGMYKNPGA